LESQKTGITTGAKEAYVGENGKMNSLPNGLKMLLKTIGAFTEVLAFMRNSKIRGYVVAGNEWFA